MNNNPGLLATKIGMTQYFDEKGEVVRCTMVKSGAIVVGKRTKERDGYDAIVVGLGERKAKHTTSPLAGQYKKSGLSPKHTLRELRMTAENAAKYEIGEKIAVDKVFQVGQLIDAQGITRGRGFTGVVRKFGFAGFVTSHGTHEYFRHGGSIGTNMTPGRVLAGKKMPGQYGNETRSTLNLEIVKLIPEDDLVLVAGGIPGARNSTVLLRGAVQKSVGTLPLSQREAAGAKG